MARNGNSRLHVDNPQRFAIALYHLRLYKNIRACDTQTSTDTTASGGPRKASLHHKNHH
jgi:hypothetical protein